MSTKAKLLLTVLAATAIIAALWVALPKHYQLSEHMIQTFVFWNDHEGFVIVGSNVSGRTTNALQQKLLRSHLSAALLVLGWNDIFYEPRVVAYHLLPSGALDRFELPPDTATMGTWALREGKLQLAPTANYASGTNGFRWDGERFVTQPASKPNLPTASSQLSEDELGDESGYPGLIPREEREKFRKGGWHVKALNGYEDRGEGADLPMQIGGSKFALIIHSFPMSVGSFDFATPEMGAKSLELASAKPAQESRSLWEQTGWREVPKAEYQKLASHYGRKLGVSGLPWIWFVVLVGLLLWKVLHWGNLLVSLGGAKRRTMKSLPTAYSFPTGSAAQFPALDIESLDRYTRELENSGFVRLGDLSLISDASTHLPNFHRVMAHTRHHCFASLAQVFPLRKPAWPLRCSFSSSLQDGWTVSFTNRKPQASGSLLRRPRAISVSMPEAGVTELLHAFIAMRDQITTDLGVALLREDSLEGFMAQTQRNLSDIRESVQKKNFAIGIPEIYLRKFALMKTRPEYVWLGDYPKLAEQRKENFAGSYTGKI